MTARAFKVNDIPDLSGKVAIVTGGTSGIGLETAYLLARRNCTVYIAARNPEKADRAIADIQRRLFPATQGVGEIIYHHLDLLDLKGVYESAHRFLRDHDRLDILVANAGTAFESIDQLSVDGYDRSFATNHLGHFAFITTLLPLLERTSGINGGDVRVVVTSSMAYQFAGNNGIDFDSIRVKSEGKSILDMKAAGRRYGRSKMANILFTQELSKRLEARGISGIRVNACHPGSIGDTGLGANDALGIPQWFNGMVHKAVGAVSFTPLEGAMTQIYLSTSKAVVEKDIRGKFYVPVMTWSMRYHYSTEYDISKALKRGDHEKLWNYSETALREALQR
ncbi:uncharacterized protein H6S33_008765 [Morchella sextelata]|uniref:uncharacterized protein n=1 Tax=Morchella sextelata TaxID=1174677 RepID=UPI001D037B50|nr:uncharacterized protein H6S33_008765 [Morchella sextelata]KAH0602426.1 hypothetical protein H6S33_008765 [Morchella sextelata]